MTPRSIQQLFDLTGKTALVTGGSRGLGLQMAQALGEAGAKLVISSRNPRGLSYVDAVSFVVMEKFEVADAFAVDPHFLSETA